MHRTLARGMADGVPINLGLPRHPVALFPDLGARRQAGDPISAIYRSHGIADHFRRSTVLYTRRAEPDEAARLMQHPDLPVMVISKVDVSADGRPVGCSAAIWAGARVQFVMENEEVERADD